jgi:hypothetical protein
MNGHERLTTVSSTVWEAISKRVDRLLGDLEGLCLGEMVAKGAGHAINEVMSEPRAELRAVLDGADVGDDAPASLRELAAHLLKWDGWLNELAARVEEMVDDRAGDFAKPLEKLLKRIDNEIEAAERAAGAG